MTPLGLSINGLARELRVPVTRMSEIVNGRRSITADTALRLARYFAMTPQFWMNLQGAYRSRSGDARLGRQNQTRRASARVGITCSEMRVACLVRKLCSMIHLAR